MKQIRNKILGLGLLLSVLLCLSMGLSIGFAQDYSSYSSRTINIQPLIPYTGLQTGDTTRAINASQTVTYGQTQNGIQSIDVQYQYKVSELEARIVRLEQASLDSQNRIAALETANSSLANQVATLQNQMNSGQSTTTPPTTTQPSNSGSSFLQVGAFSRIDLAGQLVYKLQQLGYQVYDSTSATGVTKLFVGPFANAQIPEEQYKLSLQNINDSFPIAVP